MSVIGEIFGPEFFAVFWLVNALVSLWLLAVFFERARVAIRRRRAVSLLSYIEQAVRLKVPLPEFLTAAAAGERGPMQVELLQLRDLLASGCSIAAAIQSVASVLPPRIIDLIASAERLNRLASTLRELGDQQRSRFRGTIGASLYIRYYPPLLLLVSIAILCILWSFVLPSYQNILKDFHLPIPKTTQGMIQIGQWAPMVLCILLGFCMLAWFVASLDTLKGLRHRVVWTTPFFRGAARDRALADVSHVMAMALEAGQSPAEAVDEASTLRVNIVMRRRIGRWAQALVGGAPLHEAARSAGLPGLFSGTLAMASLSGDLVGACRMLQRHYRSRFSRAANLLVAAMVPLTALLFGSLIVLIALGLFQPLIAIIDLLTLNMRAL